MKIGVVGFGFMGRTHFANWRKVPGVTIAAIWDFNPDNLRNQKISRNIDEDSEKVDLSGVQIYSDFDKMLCEQQLDAVSITVPTFMHVEFCQKAMRSGAHVLCEKPLALNARQCRQIIESAQQYGKQLMVAHCIRFWPEYMELKRIIESSIYGKVQLAQFRRFCEVPRWSLNSWLLDCTKSGGAILDLHIHDTDFVQYVFGDPQDVQSFGVVGPSGGYDHVLTRYQYANAAMVIAEGGWMMTPGFGFEMSFSVILDRATIVYNSNATIGMKIYNGSKETILPVPSDKNGYFAEISYFVDLIQGKQKEKVITPLDAMRSVEIVEKEILSANNGVGLSV